MGKRLPGITVVSIILLCIASRLPQLLSPYLLLDGDECVLATMARHLYQGKEFSLFFWGQRYGFSLIESIAVLPFYACLGFNAVAVKLGMLALWTTGVVFFYKALVQVQPAGRKVSLWLTLLLIAAPAWAVWSMKARGGYLTSFTLSAVVMYLLFHERYARKNMVYPIIGLLVVLIYESQLFWLAGVVPLLAYRLWKEWSWQKLVYVLLPMVVLLIGFHYYQARIPEGYAPQTFMPEHKAEWKLQIRRIPDYLYHSLHGNYYFYFYQSPNLFCAVFAYAFSALAGVLVLVSGFCLLFRRKGNGLLIISGLTLVLCLAYTVFTKEMEGRYLLPITGFALFALRVLLVKVNMGKVVLGSMQLMTLIGLVAVVSFYSFQFLPAGKDDLLGLIRFLKQNKTYYTFCTRSMLPWQISFYSGEEVLCASHRYPPYQERIQQAYEQGQRTAILGYTGETGGMTMTIVQPNEQFFVSFDPPREVVSKVFIFK